MTMRLRQIFAQENSRLFFVAQLEQHAVFLQATESNVAD